MFNKMLVRNDSDCVFWTDAENLMMSIEQDFPDFVTIHSIGQTWENRSINLIEISANNSHGRNI